MQTKANFNQFPNGCFDEIKSFYAKKDEVNKDKYITLLEHRVSGYKAAFKRFKINPGIYGK